MNARLGRAKVVAALLVALFTFAGVAVVGVWVVDSFGPVVVRDHAGMAEVKQRLGPVEADLSAVPIPPHTRRAAAARFVGCGRDSGEMFEPQVSREWRFTPDAQGSLDAYGREHVTDNARKAGAKIVEALVSRGWIGRPPHGTFAGTTLHARDADNHTYISIQVFHDSVLATASTPHREVCGPIF